MKKSPSERLAIETTIECLSSCGYEVQPIPEAEDPRPDLFAFAQLETLVVEVKTNVDAPLALGGDRVTVWSKEIGYSNSISAVLNKAARQLAHGPTEGKPSLCLVAYVGSGLDAEGKLDQVRATLYGLVDVTELTSNPRAVPCYYFDLAEFYRQPLLTGALLIEPGRSQICMNESSPTAEALRRTNLWTKHDEAGAVRDPRREETEGKAFAVREPIARGNDDAVLGHLAEKYAKQRLIALRGTRNVGIGFVERSE